MSFSSNQSCSPGYSEGEFCDLDEDLDIVKAEGDQVLHLNYKGLLEIPQRLISEAQDFQHITRIYLKGNKITSLPADIFRLSSLVELYIPGNKLVMLPDRIGALHSLESLDVSYNQLHSLPPSIGQLVKLEKLHLANNRISTLPEEICKMASLCLLDVINNNLHHIPVEVTKCRQLARLLVDRNHLRWLPAEIIHMEYLEELSATGNELLCLPMDMGDMKSLKCVYVDNNPYLHAIPVSVYNQELGFNSSGERNFVPHEDDQHQYQSVVIMHTATESKTIYLPREMKLMGDKDSAPVASLLELSMRVVYKQSKELHASDLPWDLYQLLKSPVCKCHVCKRPIFTFGFPLVFEGQIRVYSMYRLTLCCSALCVKLATLIVNLPLIYPSPSTLHCAIALVED